MIEQIIRKAEEYDGMIKLIEDFKTAINNLNNENNDLEEDNRRLNDRLLALEEGQSVYCLMTLTYNNLSIDSLAKNGSRR
jgi:hypothetical protein